MTLVAEKCWASGWSSWCGHSQGIYLPSHYNKLMLYCMTNESLFQILARLSGICNVCEWYKSWLYPSKSQVMEKVKSWHQHLDIPASSRGVCYSSMANQRHLQTKWPVSQSLALCPFHISLSNVVCIISLLTFTKPWKCRWGIYTMWTLFCKAIWNQIWSLNSNMSVSNFLGEDSWITPQMHVQFFSSSGRDIDFKTYKIVWKKTCILIKSIFLTCIFKI